VPTEACAFRIRGADGAPPPSGARSPASRLARIGVTLRESHIASAGYERSL
jgi:hypothetical protein